MTIIEWVKSLFSSPVKSLTPYEPSSMLMGSSGVMQDGETVTPLVIYDADSTKIVGASGVTAEVVAGRLQVDANLVTGAADTITMFGDESVVYNTTVALIQYVVPAGKRLEIHSIRGWSNIDGEYILTIGGAPKDGFRTSPAVLTANLCYSDAPIVATAGQAVRFEVTHFQAGKITQFRASLVGLEETL